MRLEKLAQDYIRYKQALGARFKTDAMHLGVFFELLNGRQSDITLSWLWMGKEICTCATHDVFVSGR
jgi:hypothetical protein